MRPASCRKPECEGKYSLLPVKVSRHRQWSCGSPKILVPLLLEEERLYSVSLSLSVGGAREVRIEPLIEHIW